MNMNKLTMADVYAELDGVDTGYNGENPSVADHINACKELAAVVFLAASVPPDGGGFTDLELGGIGRISNMVTARLDKIATAVWKLQQIAEGTGGRTQYDNRGGAGARPATVGK